MAAHLPNESALVAEARLGNGAAFGALISQYHPNLHRLALRVTGNREDAEDATQEALLKAYCNIGRFRGESRFYTWLARIALNEAFMKCGSDGRNANCRGTISSRRAMKMEIGRFETSKIPSPILRPVTPSWKWRLRSGERSEL